MAVPYSLLGPFAWHQRRRAARRQPARDGLGSRLERALQQLEHGHASDAFGLLAALADEGHVPAACIALMLSRRGAALFGGAYPASEARRERWRRLVG